MIVVTIELWPLGDKSQRETLNTVRIWNDGSGDQEIGHYGVSLAGVRGKILGRILNIPRKRQNAVRLLYYALAALFSKKPVDVSQLKDYRDR